MTKKGKFIVRFTTLALYLCSLNYSFAQEVAEDSLVLPDITTIISQEETLINEAAIPDFSGALPETFDTDTIPEISEGANHQEDEILIQGEENQETDAIVFMEGAVGLGWPYVFDANFSLYQFGDSPFSVNFIFDSFGGYGNHSQDMGFFDTNTEMEATKTFSAKNSIWKLAASYKTQDLGLQGNSVIYDDINRQTVATNLGTTLPLGNNFALSMNLDSLWFSRFAGYAGSLKDIAEEESIALSFIKVQPNISLIWQKEIFRLSLEGNWGGGFFFNTENPAINRAQGIFTANLDFPAVDLEASVGLVYIHNGSGTERTNFIVPFSLNSCFNIKLPFSEQSATIDLKGGLNSKTVDLPLLETNNPFTTFQEELIEANNEQTDWFGQMVLFLPIKSQIEFGIIADFRKTAFGNEVLFTKTDFEINPITGLFTADVHASTRFFTNVSLTGTFSAITTALSWNAHWLDKTPGQSPQSVEVSLAYIGTKNWGINLNIQENLGSEDDKTPELNFSAYFKPTDKTKILLTVTDAIKLVTGKDRVFIEPYIQQGGDVSASVQFMY